jgi:hypothetical protein
MLASALLWLTEEHGEEVAEHHGASDAAELLTVVLAIVAIPIALYLLYVFVTTPSPSGHHDDDHGHDDHGHGDHGHGDHGDHGDHGHGDDHGHGAHAVAHH